MEKIFIGRKTVNNMRYFKLIIVLGIFFFLTQNVSANFVCGQVSSIEDYSSNWMDVMVYYAENQNETTLCKVNPEGKFCCDSCELKNDYWYIPANKELKIKTDLSNDEIEKILLQFKVDKKKDFNLVDKIGQIDLELYQEDEDYNYYQVFLDRKDKAYLVH